jgi:hypothetical protein
LGGCQSPKTIIEKCCTTNLIYTPPSNVIEADDKKNIHYDKIFTMASLT